MAAIASSRVSARSAWLRGLAAAAVSAAARGLTFDRFAPRTGSRPGVRAAPPLSLAALRLTLRFVNERCDFFTYPQSSKAVHGWPESRAISPGRHVWEG